MTRFRQQPRLIAHIALVSCVGLMPTVTARVTAAEGYESWSKVESAEETREYTKQIREGKFGVPEKFTLEQIVLPQIALRANRDAIVQLRPRMREIITRGTTDPKIFDAANAVAAEYMAKLAAKEAEDPAVRVNAVMFIGDLVAADRKAWPRSAEPLAKLAGDAKMPLAVRTAAMAGLAKQVADGRGGPELTKLVAPVVTSIITTPPTGDTIAVNWLIGRALDFMPVTGGTPAVITKTAGLLADEQADADLRIRAAVALGHLAKPGMAPDLSATTDQIRSIAIAALDRDLATAEARRLSQEVDAGMSSAAGTGVAGQPGPTAVPASPEEVSTPACRRNAWRLVALANALKPDMQGGSGIAGSLQGDAATKASRLATVLREQGRAIDTTPVEQSVKNAAAALKAFGDVSAPAATSVETAAPPMPFEEAPPSRIKTPFDDPE